MITAALVKELREKTGAGMMDCKKALTETDGDIAKAIDWLRQKGISKAAKKADRIAAEGLSKVVIDGNKAIVVEINSETDFVAKNEQFLELLDKTCKTLINANATSVEEALTVAVDGGTLNDLFVNATATIGEKITLRRFEVLTKTDDQVFGAYMHMGGKISAVVVANGAKADVAKDMAMQVASMNPQYVSRANMPAEVVEHETNVQKEILKNDPKLASKPEKVLAGIIEGRVSKTLQEMCLVDQLFFKNQDIKCGQYLKENGMEVVSFVKYTVGEGLEKREENFAEEVAKQMAK
ncbi:MAG: translation elongation factor Ts [Firmicutes bacterium]|nr:translation elongation factor Ts [Erysipelotrichaceae bacterium]MDD6524826.1 translation elongation factor Ts [Bacillota bacterium]MDD7227970.1 translation elongation factor Ts [Bacillota bacterium]MDY4972393.1 translation elongation factor Ts [Erysipelotrichaceae bacterium]MDY5997133.1 translation elongation factor Ts [Erysipelotrichaceae bacterium]